MGTEEEIKEHEPKCQDNYNRRSCETCIHKKFNMKRQWYECDAGKEIPKGKIFEFCPLYERKIKVDAVDNIFGDLFGF
jgi:hypothetical protein